MFLKHLLCTIEGCGRRHEARGLCATHYSRWKRYGDPLAVKRIKTPDGLCLVDGCLSRSRGLGWCSAHYQRWLAHGDPLGEAERTDPRITFLDHVVVDPSGCWLWTAQLDSHGYGRCADYGFSSRCAHRVAYEMFVGPIPEGLELDHVYVNGCRNHNCVNWVDHLEPVTHAENMRRAAAVKPPIERCRRAGHPYDETNTYINPASGRRHCRACEADRRPARRAADAARARAKRARLRAAA